MSTRGFAEDGRIFRPSAHTVRTECTVLAQLSQPSGVICPDRPERPATDLRGDDCRPGLQQPQAGEAGDGEQGGDDPEADHDFDLVHSPEDEVVVQRGTRQHPPAEAAEADQSGAEAFAIKGA